MNAELGDVEHDLSSHLGDSLNKQRTLPHACGRTTEVHTYPFINSHDGSAQLIQQDRAPSALYLNSTCPAPSESS